MSFVIKSTINGTFEGFIGSFHTKRKANEAIADYVLLAGNNDRTFELFELTPGSEMTAMLKFEAKQKRNAQEKAARDAAQVAVVAAQMRAAAPSKLEGNMPFI